jgi:hypothetical protein
MKIIRLTQANYKSKTDTVSLKGTASTPPTLHVKTDTFGAPYTNDYVLYRRLQDRGVPESITYFEFLKPFVDASTAADSARLEPKPHKTDSIGSSFTLDFLWAYGRKPVDLVADVERLAADFDKQINKDDGTYYAQDYLQDNLSYNGYRVSVGADLDLKVALAKTDSFELSGEQRYDLGKGLADLPTSSETVEKVASWYRVFDRHFDSYFAESYVEENVDYSSNLVAGVVETLSLGFSTGLSSSFGKQSRVTLHPKPLYVESLSNSDSVAFDMTSSLEDIPETHDSCAKAILPGVVEEISAPEILDMHMQDYFASSDYVSNSYLGQTYTF